MPTPFDFTYNLNTLESIESEYFNLLKGNSETKYEPNSDFFVDGI